MNTGAFSRIMFARDPHDRLCDRYPFITRERAWLLTMPHFASVVMR
jgi:hypothetical protein